MKRILSAHEMKMVDEYAINTLGIPSLVLMENAGRGCAECIISHFPIVRKGKALILCGPGNNGGDGAVIARWLKILGCEVSILMVEEMIGSPSLELNLKLCRELGIEIIYNPNEVEDIKGLFQSASLIVDAIYGIGFRGRAEGMALEMTELANNSGKPICSVDIPSGINADNGLGWKYFRASLTIAMQACKPGHFLGSGKIACGALSCVSIGIPEDIYNQDMGFYLYEDEDFTPITRKPTIHKGDCGRLVIIGGAEGFTGATFLATGSALRSGIGYAYIYHREGLGTLFASRIPEALCRKIPMLDGRVDEITLIKMWESASCILTGPGLGTDEMALQLLKTVLQMKDIPLVLDADALNLMARHPELMEALDNPNIVITPHWGEFCRLAGVSKDALENDPIAQLKAFMPHSQSTILLKSHVSLLRHGKEVAFINTGNEGLATGGSGDVLSGIIASFMCQGLPPQKAALSAALLLGKTANMLAKKRNPASIIPSDIIASLMLNT